MTSANSASASFPAGLVLSFGRILIVMCCAPCVADAQGAGQGEYRSRERRPWRRIDLEGQHLPATARAEQAGAAGGLFGTKIVLNEFVAFIDLGAAQGAAAALSDRSRAIVIFAFAPSCARPTAWPRHVARS